MSYTRNFGMRSFENVVRDGRFRVPATGTPLPIGSPVTLDPDNPGLLKQAGDAAARGPQSGVVVYEHITARGVDPLLSSSVDAPYNVVPLGQYAQMMHGAGTKVWFKNTGDKALYDGRSIAGGGLLADSVVSALEANPTTLKPGDGLVPDADGKFRKTTGTESAWLTIEQANPSTGVVEARFTF